MFIDKTKTKVAIIALERYKAVDSIGIVEVIYDKKTRKKIAVNGVGVYAGEPRAEATWRHYKLYLDVNGKRSDTEYFTEEQYKACWKANGMCNIETSYLWPSNFNDFLIYEQDHYTNKVRKEKKPENRYLEKNLPKPKNEYQLRSLQITKEEWAKKRKEIREQAGYRKM